MGAPTLSLLAELFIQHIKHNQIFEILNKHKIIAYYRYVVDILIIYDAHLTSIKSTVSDFSGLHQKLQFTMENKSGNQLNHLDLTITRTHGNCNLEFIESPPLPIF